MGKDSTIESKGIVPAEYSDLKNIHKLAVYVAKDKTRESFYHLEKMPESIMQDLADGEEELTNMRKHVFLCMNIHAKDTNELLQRVHLVYNEQKQLMVMMEGRIA